MSASEYRKDSIEVNDLLTHFRLGSTEVFGEMLAGEL
jgi:hypothetical protein